MGIIGTGNMARNLLDDLDHSTEIQCEAVTSRSLERARQFAQRNQVPRHYDDYRSMVSNPSIDIVYIATPHGCHFEQARMCLEAGKAVLCEKPFTINAREAHELVKLARSKQVFLMEAMWTRFLPAIVELRHWLQDEILGEPKFMRSGGAFIPDHDPDHYLWQKDLGGGALLDAGVYLVSMASMVFGAPEEIRALGDVRDGCVDDHEAFLLLGNGGELASLYISLRFNEAPEAVILGEKGSVRIHAPLFAPRALTLSLNGKENRTHDFDFDGSGYRFQVLEAARCIRAERMESPIMPLDETVEIMETMDEIRRQLGVFYPADENKE